MELRMPNIQSSRWIWQYCMFTVEWTDKQRKERKEHQTVPVQHMMTLNMSCVWMVLGCRSHVSLSLKHTQDVLGKASWKRAVLDDHFTQTSLSYAVSAHFSEHYLPEKLSLVLSVSHEWVWLTQSQSLLPFRRDKGCGQSSYWNFSSQRTLFNPGNPLDFVPIGN